MDVQRTITIRIADDPDLRATLAGFQGIQQRISAACYNDGKPLSALALHRAVYEQVKGTISSQLTCTAIRLVAGAYAAARANKKPAQRPFAFKRTAALFLLGTRGRDARFCGPRASGDGILSIWTVAGRKRLAYTVPDVFTQTLAEAVKIDSMTVIERDGRLLGRVVVTLRVPDPKGIHPVGIDLNETNALVAVDPDGNTLLVSGRDCKVRNIRTRNTRRRLQHVLATRKAQKQDTRSVRRLLKRLGRRQRNRTRTFCQQTAAKLVQWAPADSVLVFERLTLPQPSKRLRVRKGTRRRLSQWPRRLMRQSVTNAAERRGLLVDAVNPAHTSQDCARCGLRGARKRHAFTCPHCGHEAHADVNAAVNIRLRYTALRLSGPRSTGPEARSPVAGDAGKRSPEGDRR
ncbi:MAG: RNA-guided endonuclease TnpB family protein [Chloroflexales bacterium]|nr:RNA-guided endonuclease TnpB family protein [Chloroflexales bacterium]